jgi:acyl-CoA thioesterase FadM
VPSSRPDAPASITIRRRVSWMDTDAAGIYHWTTAFRLAEDAEAALHTALGIVDRTFGLTPRLHVEADFHRPLRFNDPVEVRLAVESVGRTSVSYGLAVAGPDGPAVDGRIATCLIERDSRRPVAWPDDLRAALAGGGPQVERAAQAASGGSSKSSRTTSK